jgi:acyl carrier protein
MSNIALYKSAFKAAFSVEEEKLDETFCKDRVDNWDSLRQICLITTIEDLFGILFDPEDIIAFDSYEKGTGILRKYNIEL